MTVNKPIVTGLITATPIPAVSNAVADQLVPLQSQTLRNKLPARPLFQGDDAHQYLYLRCASVTVVIGNGFNAAAPGHSDVTILKTHINAYH